MALIDDFKGVFTKPNNGLMQLIVINCMVFVVFGLVDVFLVLGGKAGIAQEISRMLALPANLSSLLRKPWSIVTYMFYHQRFFHILFNMLWLYWIGQILISFLGNRRIWVLYILGGFAGAFMYILAYNIFPLFEPFKNASVAMGASAGVLAVVVGTATLVPDYGIRLLLFGNVKLKYLALVLVLLDLLNLAGSNAGGHFAHLGGGLFGFLFIKQLQNGNDWGKPIYIIGNAIDNFINRRSRLKIIHKPSSNKHSSVSVNQAEIDRILDKISEKGYNSLSATEKQVLFNASKKSQ